MGSSTPLEMADLRERCPRCGAETSTASCPTAHAEAGDVHQLNCTYYSALGEDDERYVAARAIQLFAQRRPADLLRRSAGRRERPTTPSSETGEGRAINRHDYTSSEIQGALDRPVVHRLIDLIRLRNDHPAFDGDLTVEADAEHAIRLHWQRGADVLALDVDFAQGCAAISDGGTVEPLARWKTPVADPA